MEKLEIIVKEFAAKNNLDLGTFQNNLVIAFVEALKMVAQVNNITIDKVVEGLVAGNEKAVAQVNSLVGSALETILVGKGA